MGLTRIAQHGVYATLAVGKGPRLCKVAQNNAMGLRALSTGQAANNSSRKDPPMCTSTEMDHTARSPVCHNQDTLCRGWGTKRHFGKLPMGRHPSI